jgi:cyanophycinase
MIDQHFSERQRLARLLSAIAANPYVLGVGIDENTAVVVNPNTDLEVIGQGAATIIDAREMVSNVPDVGTAEPIELINVRLHLLRAGFQHVLNTGEKAQRKVPAALEEVISIVTNFH